MKTSTKFVFIIIAASLFSCKTEELLLHGDITGIVTDAETSLPIQAASVRLNNTNDTTTTVSDGSFLLRNIVPDNYEIQSSKSGYDSSQEKI